MAYILESFGTKRRVTTALHVDDFLCMGRGVEHLLWLCTMFKDEYVRPQEALVGARDRERGEVLEPRSQEGYKE